MRYRRYTLSVASRWTTLHNGRDLARWTHAMPLAHPNRPALADAQLVGTGSRPSGLCSGYVTETTCLNCSYLS
jgi:hypothetical protein